MVSAAGANSASTSGAVSTLPSDVREPIAACEEQQQSSEVHASRVAPSVRERTRFREGVGLVLKLQRLGSGMAAAKVLTRVVKQVETKWPEVRDQMLRALDDKRKTACTACKNVLQGLATLPGLRAPHPGHQLHDVRRSLDGLVKRVYGSRHDCGALGYHMGRHRYLRALKPLQTSKRGRKSEVNDADHIAAVRAALELHSQPSGTMCLNSMRERVPSKTLRTRPRFIYEASEQVFTRISKKTMRRIMQRHLAEYKKARTMSDYCQICFDFDEKVLPAMRALMATTRQELEELCPWYFEVHDAENTTMDHSDRPAALLKHFSDYVTAHSETQQQRRRQMSTRGILDVRDVEIKRGLELRSTQKLLLSYNFHRAANEHQKPALDVLIATPPLGHISLLADWKELVTLPITWKATGEQFYGTARKEISVFGAAVAEHAPDSTQENPQILRTFVLVLSDILDHTCLRTNQLIDYCLLHGRRAQRSLEGGHADSSKPVRLYHHLSALKPPNLAIYNRRAGTHIAFMDSSPQTTKRPNPGMCSIFSARRPPNPGICSTFSARRRLNAGICSTFSAKRPPKSWNLQHFQCSETPKCWNLQHFQCTSTPKCWNLQHF